MPDPRAVAGLAVAGLFGKVPAHGDFVRRGLPSSFVAPWDAWLQAAMAAARARLGAQWEAAWDSAPAWRFALPPGACGPDAVAGVMLPSHDQVGRRFPVTLAAMLPVGAPIPGADWFDALEAAAHAGLAGEADADALAAAVPEPGAPVPAPVFARPMAGAPHAAAAPPAVAEPPDAAAPPDDGWAAQAPPAAVPPGDVLALISATPVPRDPSEDALALLLGGTSGSAPPASSPARAGTLAPMAGIGPDDADGTLAALIGAAPAAPLSAAPGGPAAAPVPDEAHTTPERLAPPVGTPDGAGAGGAPDGTLAALIGAGALPQPDTAAPAIDPDTDILSGLIDAAPAMPPAADAPAGLEVPGDAAMQDLPSAALPGAEAAPPAGTDSADLLAETPPDWHDPAALPTAPAAPEGGGWWTRGGAHVPPLVWPLAALPAPADFAYLLESAA